MTRWKAEMYLLQRKIQTHIHTPYTYASIKNEDKKSFAAGYKAMGKSYFCARDQNLHKYQVSYLLV